MVILRSLFVLFCFLAVDVAVAQGIVFQQEIRIQSRKNLFDRIKNALFGKVEPVVYPFGLATMETGDFLVTDVQHAQFLRIDREGRIQQTIQHVGGMELGAPVDVTVDRNGQVYLVDSGRRGVLRFTPDLEKADILIADDRARFTGIALSDDAIFLADAEAHCIQVYTLDGKFVRKIGRRGTALGEFNYPTGISCRGDRLIVLDTMNFRVQIMDLNGTPVCSFGQPGRGGGDFSKMKGLVVTLSGLIFVSDVEFDNVQVFDMEGRFLSVFGHRGSQPGSFWMPSGIADCVDGVIAVADTYNRRIQLFSIQEVSQ